LRVCAKYQTRVGDRARNLAERRERVPAQRVGLLLCGRRIRGDDVHRVRPGLGRDGADVVARLVVARVVLLAGGAAEHGDLLGVLRPSNRTQFGQAIMSVSIITSIRLTSSSDSCLA
jgi:hypothetical protein